MNTHYRSALFAAILIVALSSSVSAQPFIAGNIEAQRNLGDPALGTWEYTFTVTWDTDSSYALSHFNLWLDDGMHECTCDYIGDEILLPAMTDPTQGVYGCDLDFTADLECNGDPSIGLEGTIIKFEPVELDGCEAGTTGEVTYTFYSDYTPSNIYLPNVFLSDKSGLQSATGEITGVFPGLPCDPTDAETVSWGALKKTFSR